MEKVYMIAVYRKETKSFNWLKTGRNSTPFSTTSESVAKSQRTRMMKTMPTCEYAIFTVDPMTCTCSMNLKHISC